MSRAIRKLITALIIGVCSVHMAAAAETTTPVPSTAPEIWLAIDGQVRDLHGAIATGALATVHQHAYAVRDLVRGLPAHSQGLAEASMNKVKEQVKFVDTLAARLDQSGDANDKAGTEANLNKLEGVLKTIRNEYPSSK